MIPDTIVGQIYHMNTDRIFKKYRSIINWSLKKIEAVMVLHGIFIIV